MMRNEMDIKTLKEKIVKEPNVTNDLFDLKLNDKITVRVYTNSIIEYQDSVLFIAKEGIVKSLFIIANNSTDLCNKLEGTEIPNSIFVKKAYKL